jgi:hypothetical protein
MLALIIGLPPRCFKLMAPIEAQRHNATLEPCISTSSCSTTHAALSGRKCQGRRSVVFWPRPAHCGSGRQDGAGDEREHSCTRHGDSVVGDAVAAAVVHNDEHRQWLHLIPRCHADSWADGHPKVTPAPQEQQACAARGAESSSRSGDAKIRGNAKRNMIPPRMAWWSLNRDGQQQPGFGCKCRFGINTATQPHTQHHTSAASVCNTAYLRCFAPICPAVCSAPASSASTAARSLSSLSLQAMPEGGRSVANEVAEQIAEGSNNASTCCKLGL